MSSHLALLVLFAVFVSLIFAVLLRDELRAQARYGARMLGGLLGAAFLLSWILYALPL